MQCQTSCLHQKTMKFLPYSSFSDGDSSLSSSGISSCSSQVLSKPVAVLSPTVDTNFGVLGSSQTSSLHFWDHSTGLKTTKVTTPSNPLLTSLQHSSSTWDPCSAGSCLSIYTNTITGLDVSALSELSSGQQASSSSHSLLSIPLTHGSTGSPSHSSSHLSVDGIPLGTSTNVVTITNLNITITNNNTKPKKPKKGNSMLITKYLFIFLLLLLHSSHQQETSHQLIIFAVEGLSGRSAVGRIMPFIGGAATFSGTYTIKARTVLAYDGTASVPGWIAHLFAATPAEYGCASDRDVCAVPPDTWDYKSIIDVLAYDQNYDVQLYIQGDTLNQALKNKWPTRTFDYVTHDMEDYACDEQNLPQTNRRALLFHFVGAEHTARSYGYSSANYDYNCRCIDASIRRMVLSLWEWEPERSTFVVIGDHGGSGFSHDQFDLMTLQVPIIMWGYGINEGMDMFRRPVDATQTSPTILEALGYEIPEHWLHTPLKEAYQTSLQTRNENQTTTIRGVTLSRFKVSTRSDPYEEPSYCPLQQTYAHTHAHTAHVVLLTVLLVGFAVFAFILYFFTQQSLLKS